MAVPTDTLCAYLRQVRDDPFVPRRLRDQAQLHLLLLQDRRGDYDDEGAVVANNHHKHCVLMYEDGVVDVDTLPTDGQPVQPGLLCYASCACPPGVMGSDYQCTSHMSRAVAMRIAGAIQCCKGGAAAKASRLREIVHDCNLSGRRQGYEEMFGCGAQDKESLPDVMTLVDLRIRQGRDVRDVKTRYGRRTVQRIKLEPNEPRPVIKMEEDAADDGHDCDDASVVRDDDDDMSDDDSVIIVKDTPGVLVPTPPGGGKHDPIVIC